MYSILAQYNITCAGSAEQLSGDIYGNKTQLLV
jgi:hypothetical protein